MLLATRNQAKAEQLRGLFAGLPLRFSYPEQVVKAPAVSEDGRTHLDNARQKAVAWSQAVGGLAVASDGGLVVPALQDAWNSLTTRRAMGEGLDDRERAERMLGLMRPYHGEDRRVSFAEALAVARSGKVLGAWQAEGLHGLLADSFEPAPETPEGFWGRRPLALAYRPKAVLEADRGRDGGRQGPVAPAPSASAAAGEEAARG